MYGTSTSSTAGPGPMHCESSCLPRLDHLGMEACCHSCLYFQRGRCVALEGFSFFPRMLWREASEA